MINRTDIQNKLNGNQGDYITLSGVLSGLLENVEPVDFSMEVTADADDEISKLQGMNLRKVVLVTMRLKKTLT